MIKKGEFPELSGQADGDMTFNQIKYFLTVAECLSFTEAAKRLFITQPALSRQIGAMEEELGTQLFLRDRKQLKLTPGGSLLYNRFHVILDYYTQAVYDARTANRGFEGKLRIGFLDIYDISELFPAAIREFREKYPKVALALERYPLGELPQKLYDGSLDLVLTYGFSLFDRAELVVSNVQKFTSCIMLPAGHPLAQKEDLCLADLAGERFVQLEESASEEGHRFIVNLLEKGGIHPDILFVHKMEDVLLWVQTGNAVAITSNRTIEKQNAHVVLREIQMEEARGHDVAMAWHKSNYNPAIALFMEMLEQHCRRQEGSAAAGGNEKEQEFG